MRQGEGGEQGDPLMPALYALGQHKALQHAASQLREGEYLFAYLDDLYVLCPKERAAAAYRAVAESVATRAGVQSHLGKLRAWCSGGGPAPADLAALGDSVWTADLPPEDNGLQVLGVPIGTAEYVKARGGERLQEERELLNLLPDLPDTQCAWLLLALSAVPRANHLLRTVPPSQISAYAKEHDAALWTALNKLLGTEQEPEASLNGLSHKVATLPARHGGLGLRSAERTSTAAYWAGWVDTLKVLQEKHPRLTQHLLETLEKPLDEQPNCLQEASAAKSRLQAAGFRNALSWRNAAGGVEAPQPQDAEVGEWRHGWQYHASLVLENYQRDSVVMPQASRQQQALLRSQAGHAAGKWLTALPTEPALELTPLRMQVALRLRLHYKLPLGPKRCNGRSCRAVLDEYGVHWTACSRSGRLRRRAKPLERMWARVFREAGARVQTDVLLRNTNLLGIAANDGRQLEVVATGLPLYRGVPLGVDCTMVAPLHADGRPWEHADTTDAVAIRRGERDKVRKYPELVNNGRLRLTTLATETGGRWSSNCVTIVRLLAKAKARSAPEEKQARVAAGWANRWWNLLAVTGRNTLAATLVDDKPLLSLLDGHDGNEPVWPDVLLEGAGLPLHGDLEEID